MKFVVTKPIFNVNINYPTEENKLEFDIRAGKAVAKILMEILTPEKIDELLIAYKKEDKQK